MHTMGMSRRQRRYNALNPSNLCRSPHRNLIKLIETPGLRRVERVAAAQHWLCSLEALNEMITATEDSSQLLPKYGPPRALKCMTVQGCQDDGALALPHGVRIRFLLHPNDIHAWLSHGLSPMATHRHMAAARTRTICCPNA